MNLTFRLILFAIMLLGLLLLLLRNQQSAIHTPPRRRPRRHKGFRRAWRKLYLAPIGIARLRSWLPGQARSACLTTQFANIGEGTLGDGCRSYYGDATTTSRYLLYKRGTDADHCAITTTNDDPIGCSDDQVDDTAVPITLNIFGAKRGTLRVVTDGTMVDGDYCKCGTVGRATKATNGDLVFGRALIPTDSTSAAGDVIQVIHFTPGKLAF